MQFFCLKRRNWNLQYFPIWGLKLDSNLKFSGFICALWPPFGKFEFVRVQEVAQGTLYAHIHQKKSRNWFEILVKVIFYSLTCNEFRALGVNKAHGTHLPPRNGFNLYSLAADDRERPHGCRIIENVTMLPRKIS